MSDATPAPAVDTLSARLQTAMKDALRARQKDRLGALRLAIAAIRQREIDERVTLDDAQTLAVLEKLCKQRRESIAQYRDAGRDDLAERERFELSVLQEFLPAQLDDAAIDAAIDAALSTTGATTPRDMGKVMGVLKPQLVGRADMSAVSARVRQRLSS